MRNLSAVVITGVAAAGIALAAAAPASAVDVNDNDLVDVDDTLNDLNTNVLGIANQDSPVDIL